MNQAFNIVNGDIAILGSALPVDLEIDSAGRAGEGAVEVEGGADERQVREGLREVAQGLAARPIRSSGASRTPSHRIPARLSLIVRMAV